MSHTLILDGKHSPLNTPVTMYPTVSRKVTTYYPKTRVIWHASEEMIRIIARLESLEIPPAFVEQIQTAEEIEMVT